MKKGGAFLKTRRRIFFLQDAGDKDFIKGDLEFRGSLGSKIEGKNDKKGNPYLTFSAFSTEKNGDETSRTSAFINIEAWRKNENTSSFERLTKGPMLTVEGYFKPEEWNSEDGVKHNRVVFVATKFYEPVEKEETPAPKAETPKKKGK